MIIYANQITVDIIYHKLLFVYIICFRNIEININRKKFK